MIDLDDIARRALRYLVSFPPGPYHRLGNWPAGQTDRLIEMQAAGLVLRRPQPKSYRRPSDFWTATEAGRAAYAANPLPPIVRRSRATATPTQTEAPK